MVVSSIATDYQFLCNQNTEEWLLGLLGATYMIGMLIGSFFIGLYSDYAGRMKALMLSIVLVSACGTIGTFMPEPFRWDPYKQTNTRSTQAKFATLIFFLLLYYTVMAFSVS